MTAGESPEKVFETHRRYLTGLAYRMLGSLVEAEDIVQEAYLRWYDADHPAIENVRAFLSRIVTRLCLDHLKSARVRREKYVGPWLPDPVLDDEALAADSASDLAHNVSVAFMLTLERLSPLERAAFLLHDVFDVDFAQVARTLGRTETACRQLAARARSHIRESRPRFEASKETGVKLAEAFLNAARTGDAQVLARLLAEDAMMQSDGGGKRLAALRPIIGRDKIARFFIGVARKGSLLWGYNDTPAQINGQPGFIITEPDGHVSTMAFDIRDGVITSIYIVRNPEKLCHVSSQQSHR
jgi:RNA polymerase sigma-70 factor (ECF subfamily)